MNKDKKKEIENFLIQLEKMPEGKDMIKGILSEDEKEIPKIEEKILEEKVIREPEPVIEEILKDKKDKKDKNWWEKIFNKDKLKKSKKIAVLYLRNSGNAEPLEVEPKKGFLNVDGKSYHERRDCVWTITKDRIPLAIIREGNLTPIGTGVWEEKSLQEKFSELQDHVLRGIRHAELVRIGDKDTTQIDMKKAVGIGILAIIVVAVVMNFI